MLTLQRGAAIAVAILVAGAFVGCKGAQSPSDDAVPMNGTDNVATVNGVGISQSDFYQELQVYRPVNQTESSEPAGNVVLGSLIKNSLLEQLAKKDGVFPTPAQVNQLFANITLINESTDVKPIEDQLSDSGFTQDRYKSSRIVPQLCQLNILAKGKTATDSEIQAYYDQHKLNDFTKPDRAHIKRILLASKADADEVYAEIRQGTPFEQLLSRSIDQQWVNGDYPYWIGLDPVQPQAAPLINVIKSTEVGQTSPPFLFQKQWWLVKVVDKRPKEVWALDKAKPVIEFAIEQQEIQTDQIGQQQFSQDLQAALVDADIQVTDPRYKTVVDQLKTPPPPQPMPQQSQQPGGPQPGATMKPRQ